MTQTLTQINTYKVTIKKIKSSVYYIKEIRAYRPDSAEYLALLDVASDTGIDTEYLTITNIIKL